MTQTAELLKVNIVFQTENKSKDIAIIAEPYNITVEFNAAKTEVFNKYGDDRMLNMWCEQILAQRYPHYTCILIKAKQL